MLQHLAASGRLDKGLKIRTLCMPDIFLEHMKTEDQLQHAGLTAPQIAAAALQAIAHEPSYSSSECVT